MNSKIKLELKQLLSKRWADPGLEIINFKKISSGWSRTGYELTVCLSKDSKQLDLIIQVESKNGLVSSSVKDEYTILTALKDSSVPVAEVYLLHEDDKPLGGPFIVEQKVEGQCYDMFNRHHQKMLGTHWENQTNLPNNLLKNVVALHNTPLERVSFLPQAPSAQETSEWEIHRCEQIAQDIGMYRDPYVALALGWLRRNKPSSGWLTLVHGDINIRNLIIQDEQVAAFLDWELVRISNPLFDLAYMCIPYLAGKFYTPGSDLASSLFPVEWLVANYQKSMGITFDDHTFRFWRVLATLSLLLISETGVTYYERKQSTNIRFAWVRFLLPVLQSDLLEQLK